MISYKRIGLICIVPGIICLLLTISLLIGEGKLVFLDIFKLAPSIFNIGMGVYFRRMTEEQYNAHVKRTTPVYRIKLMEAVGVLCIPLGAFISLIAYMLFKP